MVSLITTAASTGTGSNTLLDSPIASAPNTSLVSCFSLFFLLMLYALLPCKQKAFSKAHGQNNPVHAFAEG
jgi:hypothetical protein